MNYQWLDALVGAVKCIIMIRGHSNTVRDVSYVDSRAR